MAYILRKTKNKWVCNNYTYIYTYMLHENKKCTKHWAPNESKSRSKWKLNFARITLWMYVTTYVYILAHTEPNAFDLLSQKHAEIQKLKTFSKKQSISFYFLCEFIMCTLQKLACL